MRVNHLESTVSQIATWTPAQTSASRDNAPGPLDLQASRLRLLRSHMRRSRRSSPSWSWERAWCSR